MNQKTVLIIGGTSGIGREFAKNLSKTNRVSIVGRNKEVGKRLAKEYGLSFIQADVSKMADVRLLAERWGAEHDSLDLLIHSADVLRTERLDTSEGFELTFATNYLSRFFLNSLLLDNLKQSKAATIVHIAAAGFPGKLNLEHVPPPKNLSSFSGHNIGQRANDVYGLELARRLEASSIRVLILNPGMVDTGIRKRMEGVNIWARAFVGVMEKLVKGTPPETFVKTVLGLIENPAIPSGLYGPKGNPMRVQAHQSDKARGRELWRRTEETLRPFSVNHSVDSSVSANSNEGVAA